MPNLLTISVENPDEILNAGAYGTGALIRLQWSATEAGAFADVSGTGSTPTLAVVTATRSYTGYDPNGTSSIWYRTRFENAAATRVSDWSAAFQTGDETAGLLCSTYDVFQKLRVTSPSANDTELLFEVIRDVSSEIEDYIGAWLAPRPTNATSTTTYRFDVERMTSCLWLRRGGRYVGIRSLSSINLATTSQPESGGTYTAGTVADVLIRPQPSEGAPGWRLELSDYPTGSFRYFYAGYNTLEVTGGFGPASVPYWLQGIAVRTSAQRFLPSPGTATATGVGTEGGAQLLADMLPADRMLLEQHRFTPVA